MREKEPTLVYLNPSITFCDIKGTIPSLCANISSGIGEVFCVNKTWSIPAISSPFLSFSISFPSHTPTPLLLLLKSHLYRDIVIFSDHSHNEKSGQDEGARRQDEKEL